MAQPNPIQNYSDTSDDDDEIVATLATSVAIPGINISIYTLRKTIWKTRAPNKPRQFHAVYHRFLRIYFSEFSTYSDLDERRLRMPLPLFNLLFNGLIGCDLFTERIDALEKNGIHPKIGIISALRTLSYDMSYGQTDDLCELSAPSVRNIFLSFVREVVYLFGEKCLRSPTEIDRQRILKISASRWFPSI